MSHRVVVLEDAMLAALTRDQRFLAEFPFLQKLAATVAQPTRRRCGTCGSKNRERVNAFHSAKVTLLAMDDTRRKRLKELLQADEIQVFTKDGRTRKLGKHAF